MTQQEMLARERRIMGAWERFLQSGEVAPNTVHHLIDDSCRRCWSASVEPALTQVPMLLTEEEFMVLRARYRGLLEASVPIMAQARELLAESGTIMILTDPSGVILQTEGDPATVDAAHHIRMQTGAHLHERACGTNAIGTALAVGGPAIVHGAEHFIAGGVRLFDRRRDANPWGSGTHRRDESRHSGARRHHGGDPDVPRQSHPGRTSPPHRQEHAVPQNPEIRAGPHPPNCPTERRRRPRAEPLPRL
jgi:hypothetical protein